MVLAMLRGSYASSSPFSSIIQQKMFLMKTSLPDDSLATDLSALTFDREGYRDILQIMLKFGTSCS